ncbi:hypothetical protein [[Pseudomonas] boreopolis]|uniref:hypothetical protein n=1 Tax=Xanthomonas boreopolis TaxID=86183 RepID=UPI003DA09777
MLAMISFSRLKIIFPLIWIIAALGCVRESDGPKYSENQQKAVRVATDEIATTEPTSDSRPVSTSSWHSYLSQLSEDDQSYLITLSSKYYGTLEYEGREAEMNLMRLGFPRIEDWIKARSLSSEQLRSLAEKGDQNSKIFYAERIAERIDALQKATGEKSLGEIAKYYTPSELGDIQNDAVYAYATSAELLRSRPTAFNAYLFGRVYSATHGNDAPIAASILLAHDLGDERAREILFGYSSNEEKIAPSLTLDTYKSMRKMAGLP